MLDQTEAFIGFEIEQREHSPNAVIGILEVIVNGKPKEKRIFITAAGTTLGKKLGDHLAQQIKDCLEKEYSVAIFVNKVSRYIKENFRRDIKQSEVAAHVGLGSTHFCHRFTENFGKKYIDYLTQMRVDYAKHLLDTTQKPVQEIGKESGFGCAHNYHKRFLVYSGLTPGEYRRQCGSLEC